MGCGAESDPDPPTSFPPAVNGNSGRTDITKNDSSAGEWENRILGMWNTLLERLSNEEVGQQDGRG